MTIYIYLLINTVAVVCDIVNRTLSCSSISNSHFYALLSLGTLECVFELFGIIRIYSRKADNNDEADI